MNGFADDLDNCVVEVFEGEKSKGMGCLIDNKLIITCNHIFDPNSNEKLSVNFLQLSDTKGQTRKGAKKVITFLKEDLAFLEINEELPKDSFPAKLSFKDDNDNHNFVTCRHEGVIKGQIVKRVHNREKVQLSAGSYENLIFEGLSGSPVLDEKLKSVIGIVRLVVDHDKFICAISSDKIL
jgi:V8-like Glu-specific endopeptidase